MAPKTAIATRSSQRNKNKKTVVAPAQSATGAGAKSGKKGAKGRAKAAQQVAAGAAAEGAGANAGEGGAGTAPAVVAAGVPNPPGAPGSAPAVAAATPGELASAGGAAPPSDGTGGANGVAAARKKGAKAARKRTRAVTPEDESTADDDEGGDDGSTADGDSDVQLVRGDQHGGSVMGWAHKVAGVSGGGGGDWEAGQDIAAVGSRLRPWQEGAQGVWPQGTPGEEAVLRAMRGATGRDRAKRLRAAVGTPPPDPMSAVYKVWEFRRDLLAMMPFAWAVALLREPRAHRSFGPYVDRTFTRTQADLDEAAGVSSNATLNVLSSLVARRPEEGRVTSAAASQLRAYLTEVEGNMTLAEFVRASVRQAVGLMRVDDVGCMRVLAVLFSTMAVYERGGPEANGVWQMYAQRLSLHLAREGQAYTTSSESALARVNEDIFRDATRLVREQREHAGKGAGAAKAFSGGGGKGRDRKLPGGGGAGGVGHGAVNRALGKGPCHQFNSRGSCSFESRPGGCVYAHACAMCGGGHPAADCHAPKRAAAGSP